MEEERELGGSLEVVGVLVLGDPEEIRGVLGDGSYGDLGGVLWGSCWGNPLNWASAPLGEGFGLSMVGQPGSIQPYAWVAPRDKGIWRGRRPPWGGGEVRKSVTLGYGCGSAGGWQVGGLSAPCHPTQSRGIGDSQAE